MDYCTAKKSTGIYLVVYSLTATGLQFASEFFTGSTAPFNVHSIEISPNGNKLIFSNYYENTYLFDFNKYLGTISNKVLLTGSNTYEVSLVQIQTYSI